MVMLSFVLLLNVLIFPKEADKVADERALRRIEKTETTRIHLEEVEIDIAALRLLREALTAATTEADETEARDALCSAPQIFSKFRYKEDDDEFDV